MQLRRLPCLVWSLAVIATTVATAAPARAGHAQPHATIKYWDIGTDPVIRGQDPHETIEDLEGVTGHVATPSAPLTLVTSMENTLGGYCGPLYWNPVTNKFKTYGVTGGLQVAVDVNRTAPVLTNGGKTFQPGDSWFTVRGNSGFGVYVHLRNSDNFRRYPDLLGSAVGVRVHQDNGKIYAAGFDDGQLLELDPATNAARRWNIGSRPYWVDIDSAGRVYTAAAADTGGTEPDQIVRLDPATNEVRRWDIPGGGLQDQVVFGMGNGNRIDGEDNFWFSVTNADKIGRLRPGANTVDLYTRPAMDDPNGIATSGAGSSLQAFFTERDANHISVATASVAVPVSSTVTPEVSTVTPETPVTTPVDFVIAPVEATIPPQTFDSPGNLVGGIVRFPVPPGTAAPTGISRVVAPGTIYGSIQESHHVFGTFSSAITAPPGGCPTGPTISTAITRPVPGKIYENNIETSGTPPDIVVRGSPLTVTATTSNPANTAKVDVFIDGVLLGTDLTSPYSVTVPTNLPPGPHSIRVMATQADKPACRAVADLPVIVECYSVTVTIDRPQSGRVYDNDIDIGPSGGDVLVLGGNLTAQATSSNPARTARVEFSLDGGPPVSDATAPYQAVFSTNSLSPSLHELTARAVQHNPFCSDTARRPFRKPDPSVKGVAKSFYAATNVPAEPQLHIGGVDGGPKDDSEFIRIVDQPLAPVVDYLHVMTDQTQTSTGPLRAESDSLIKGLSLLNGLIEVDVLHAHVTAELTGGVNVVTSDDGTEIVGLRINGSPVASLDQPNLTITLPNGMGQVVIQETIVTGEGAHAEITVNMIHAFLETPQFKGEIIVGSAFAGVNLAGNVFDGPEGDLIHRIDDAGTDTDAGSTAADAIQITPGLISGAMTPGDDVDMYAFDTLQGERILGLLKPSEREIVRIDPIPTAPPPLTVPGILAYLTDVASSVVATGPFLPNFDLVLRDPTGKVRSTSNNGLSLPERAELNADMPFEPPGQKATWTLAVVRASGSADGFYSLDLSLLPEPLMEQNDAGSGIDASDLCSTALALPVPATHPHEIDDYMFSGVIRDTDQSDFFTFEANIGQLLSVVLKPDELDDGADFNLYLYGPRNPGGVPECSAPIKASELGGSPAKALPDAVTLVPAQMSGTYAIEIRRVNAVANYYVNVNVTNPLPNVPDNDARSGSDAPNACPSGLAPSERVFEGTLRDIPSQDFEDWYSIDVASTDDLALVLHPSPASNMDVYVYGPGNCITPLEEGVSVLGPEVVLVPNAGAGQYQIRVVRVSGGGNYVVGTVPVRNV